MINCWVAFSPLSNLNNCCIVSWIDLIKVGETFIKCNRPSRKKPLTGVIRMTRWGWSVWRKVNRAFERLETTLGPDTETYDCVSGPIVAQWLQGDCDIVWICCRERESNPSVLLHSLRIHTACCGRKSRFQLFGNMVNMGKGWTLIVPSYVCWGDSSWRFLPIHSIAASYMETLGHGNRIQLSKRQRRCWIDAEKSHWIDIIWLDPVRSQREKVLSNILVLHGGEDSHSVGQLPF
jgi:hypothetical protein